MNKNNFILADGRWSGDHGIGRFSTELLKRLQSTDIFTDGPSPLSIQNLLWQPYKLFKLKDQYEICFSPGFNPIIFSSIKYVFAIHDLIHLHVANKNDVIKKMFYQSFIKPSIHRAFKIITVSEFSKKTIIAWSKVSEDKVTVIPNGVSHNFSMDGEAHQPGYPYLLYVGNHKPHKNLPRLLEAFANSKIDSSIKLLLTGSPNHELAQIMHQFQLEKRIIFCTNLTETQLANHYRGALATIIPSLYEGFGLPIIESMACGTPVLTSNVTAIPEVAGDAALLVNPLDTREIAQGIEIIVKDSALRNEYFLKGIQRAKLFSWDDAAIKLQTVLNSAL